MFSNGDEYGYGDDENNNSNAVDDCVLHKAVDRRSWFNIKKYINGSTGLGRYLDSQDGKGNTPLMVAVLNYRELCSTVMPSYDDWAGGAERDFRSFEKEYDDIINYLLDHNPALSVRNDDGKGVLELARDHAPEVVETLLKKMHTLAPNIQQEILKYINVHDPKGSFKPKSIKEFAAHCYPDLQLDPPKKTELPVSASQLLSGIITQPTTTTDKPAVVQPTTPTSTTRSPK